MIEITLKVIQTEKHNFNVEYPSDFENLSSQTKLNLLTDAIIELNKKWREVDGDY